MACAELLVDGRKETCVAFMGRARDFCRGLGVEVGRVMTDNGPGCHSQPLDEWLAASGIAHGCTRPHGPWQNGKARRMNGTLAQKWQYARAYASEGERAAALSPFIDRHDWERPHGACGGLPPMSRIVGVNNVMAHNS